MPVQELDLRASMLREQLWAIKNAPEDKSINQLREEAIMRTLEEVVELARMLAVIEDVYAIGQNPEQAIRALAHFKGWGEVTGISELKGGDPKYTWGRRFLVDGGTGMKAAGWEVPGGVVLTWWK